ncbi:MAG TPA: hypothetical protein VJQ54_17570 [Candidatus Sulfotelmatobacter sp.]|nr:hypothetical protein [Candidatus Sulfotelmatobacter sp.]
MLRLTAPKHASDLRMGACINTGSRPSGATHMRQRDPVPLEMTFIQTPYLDVLALCQAPEFFTAATRAGSDWGDLRTRFAQPETHLTKQPLALAHAEPHAIVLAQVLRHSSDPSHKPTSNQDSRDILRKATSTRCHCDIQCTRTPKPVAFAQSVQTAPLETPAASLHGRRRLAKQLAHLCAKVAAANQ